MKKFVYLMITATLLLTTIIYIDTRSAIALLTPYASISGQISAVARGPNDFIYKYNEPFTAEEEPFRKTYLLDKFYENPYPGANPPLHDALQYSGRAVAFGGALSKPAYFNVIAGIESQTDNNLSSAYTGMGLGAGYSTRIDEISTPPSPVPGGKVPIKMKASGWAKTSARPPRGSVYADCRLTVRELFDGEVYEWEADAGGEFEPDYHSFEVDQIIYLTPSRVGSSYYVNVEVTMTAQSGVYVYSAAKAEAEANVDPVFTFDQAAFDALMGENTFPLKEYYAFAFSTGINVRGNTNPIRSNPSIPLLLLDE